MRTRSLLHFSLQVFPQILRVVAVLLALFTSTIWELAWAADSDSVPRQQTSAQAAPAPNLSAANQVLQRQGPVFIENRGQFDSRVKFLVKGNGANLWLTNEGIVFDFQRPTVKQSPDASQEKRESLKPLSRGP